MTLAPGARLGPYEVLGPIGAGGMGQVFRARDTRLGRDVAIKVLPPELVADPERLARFEREARVLAALNHPGIAAIYGVQEEPGTPALVLELVEGETLHERLGRGPLPVADALAIARQLADALDAAHERGIVHRDLKPANVALTRDGVVKVLDFGLAKPGGDPGRDGTDVRTLTAPGTREGVVLGTAAYMSPEQARGQPVDKRTDVWAFGCVLYEMLTGRLAFGRATLSDTIAAVLEREPDLEVLPAATPPGVRVLLERCLRKDRRRRLRDVGDAGLELEALGAGREAGRENAAPPRRGRFSGLLVAAALVAAALAGVVAARARPAPLDVAAFRFVPLAAEPGDESSPAWSPDGRSVAYVAESRGVRQLFTRSLDAAAAARITSLETDAQRPFWSPDGSRVYFSDGGTYLGDLWSVGATGGEPQRVLEDASVAAVSPDGRTLAFLRGKGGQRGLWLASTAALQAQRYETAPFPKVFNRSQAVAFSPDGTRLAVLLDRQEGEVLRAELWIVPWPGGAPRSVLREVHDLPVGRISWLPDGRHLVLSGELGGRPGRHLYLADTRSGDVVPITAGTVEEDEPSVSPDGGQIAFAAGGDDFDLVRVPLDGSRPEVLLASARNETEPTWSPGASQLAYATNARGRAEIWVRALQEGWARPVVHHDADPESRTSVGRPGFSPDGERLVHEVYVGAMHTVWVSSFADGRGVPLDAESRDQHSPAWSPDGRFIAYQRLLGDAWELVKVPSGGGTPVRLDAADPGGGPLTAWSPAGEWIAHVRDERLWLTPAAGDGRPRAVSDWPSPAFGFSRDGSLLYAARGEKGGRWTLVTFDVASGKLRRQTALDLPAGAMLAGFSLHPDGRSFATGVGLARHDIWLLQGFRPPPHRLGFAGF